MDTFPELMTREERIEHGRPLHVAEQMEVLTLEALLRYWNRYADGNSVMFAGGPENPSFTAVLDYHRDLPEPCAHVVRYGCPKTVDWLDWEQVSGHPTTQVRFAQFIEDHVEAIIQPEGTRAPDGATMLEVARTLEVRKKVLFRSAVRLDNGERQLQLEEEIQGTTTKGNVQVPEELYVALRPFLECPDHYQVRAKLRYRIGNDGELAMWVELHRPDKVLESAYRGIAEQVEAVVGEDAFFVGRRGARP